MRRAWNLNMAYYSVRESKLVKVLQSYTEQPARKRHRAATVSVQLQAYRYCHPVPASGVTC